MSDQPIKVTVTRPLNGVGFHAKEADYLWIKVEGGTPADRDTVALAAEDSLKPAKPEPAKPRRPRKATAKRQPEDVIHGA